MRSIAMLSYALAAAAAWLPYAAVKIADGPEWALAVLGVGAIASNAIALFVISIIGGWND